MVPAVVVSVALPLGRDAGTLPERADRTREVVPPARTLGAALNSCRHTERKRGLELIRRSASLTCSANSDPASYTQQGSEAGCGFPTEICPPAHLILSLSLGDE